MIFNPVIIVAIIVQSWVAKASRVAGAHSEFVVFHAGHSVQSNPEAIQEVRRILLEQLAESP